MKEQETLDARYVCQTTQIYDQKFANAAIRTLLWLEQGAPRTMIEGRPDVIFNNRWVIKKSLHQPIRCCIAGAILLFTFQDEIFDVPVKSVNPEDLSTAFNYEDGQGDPLEALFMPGLQYHDARPDKCARVLRHYLTTGEVDWSL